MKGERLEVDHPDALAVQDGVALFVGPSGVPAVFDHEGGAQVIGDLVSLRWYRDRLRGTNR